MCVREGCNLLKNSRSTALHFSEPFDGFFFFCAFPFYLFSFDQYNCKTTSFFLRCVFVKRSMFADHLYFFFFELLRVSLHFFFFDRLRSKTPSFSFSSSRNPSSPLSRLQRPLLLSFLPLFFAFMCETSSVKDRYRCMSQVFTQYILCEKKKKKRMDELFGNIWYTCAACAYFVTVLKVEC